MLKISKEEAKLIRENFPECKLSTTCKLKNNGGSRGVAYIEETKKYLSYLETIRSKNIVFEYGNTKIDI